jgi:peptidoglycan/LPS O-acetylase OafA/YrhL
VIYRSGIRLSRSASLVFLALAFLEFAWLNSDWLNSNWQIHLPRPIGYGIPAAQAFAAVTLIDRNLVFPYFEKLGDASYALYLIHPAVISIARMVSIRGNFHPTASPVFYLFGIVAACIGAALVVHFVFEKPVTDGLKRRLDALRLGLPRVPAT